MTFFFPIIVHLKTTRFVPVEKAGYCAHPGKPILMKLNAYKSASKQYMFISTRVTDAAWVYNLKTQEIIYAGDKRAQQSTIRVTCKGKKKVKSVTLKAQQSRHTATGLTTAIPLPSSAEQAAG